MAVAAPNAAHAAEIICARDTTTWRQLFQRARRRLLCEVPAFMHSNEKLSTFGLVLVGARRSYLAATHMEKHE